ncbi:MAG: phosphoribosylformylglycinamidine cyclo-ligase [Candidatus Omnitrophica bacterium]|nr:phosphoribosylformylglycinamidine cyclo-ligase [Candidatus Omnitrophota bacterium]
MKVTYKKSGVDIEKANKLIDKIRKRIDTTRVPGSMDSVGGFGGCFDPARSGVKNSLLVASTDGVGTKLKIAQIAGKHDTIGIDLVAMCVNDVLCCGAKPLFFLDYFATGKLDGKIWEMVLEGIIRGCKMAECSLLGGETAEMPGMYPKGEYDLAGFSVGIVDRTKVINGKKIKQGDVVLGLASSGLHSNGYSLIRKIFGKNEIKKHAKLLLEPTIIYVKPFMELMRRVEVKGAANITGGGFYDNIPRTLPKNVKAVIKKGSWVMPEVFKLVTKKAEINERELYRTLNMGIGMVLVLSKKEAEKAKKILAKDFKLKSWVIGQIVNGKRETELV